MTLSFSLINEKRFVIFPVVIISYLEQTHCRKLFSIPQPYLQHLVAAVGRRMAFRPGISGKLFAALGEADINIRMINQGPDELNIIFGVDNKDFKAAIRVLYDSFVK